MPNRSIDGLDYPALRRAPVTIIVVGGDALALRVCEELTAIPGRDVVLLWPPSAELAERVGACGARFVGREPDDEESLRRAGVLEAAAILILTGDDRITLHVALKARDLNTSIRIVLRQFNRTLGRKLEQYLKNCSVVSLSAHAAATYAAAAVDHDCFQGLQFPDIDGPLTGFSERPVARAGIEALTVAEAERQLDARILAIDGDLNVDRKAPLRGRSSVTIFGRVRPNASAPSRAMPSRLVRWFRPLEAWRALRRGYARLDPLARGVIALALLVVASGTLYFGFALQLDPLTSLYYVITTMTTTGFGDISARAAHRPGLFVSILLMISGLIFTGIFYAVLTTKFTQAQWVAVQGLRHVARSGHVVVCGAGNVGSRVIDYLVELKCRVVVIEAEPRPEIVERSRDNHFDLLTGDATRDSTLDLCNIAHAEALIALTNGDTNNLEVALGARARNPALPIVMRCQEGSFATSIVRYFEIDRTFGTIGLAAPVIAGLASDPGARGRVAFCGHEFAIVERLPGETPPVPPEAPRLPLCAWRDGHLIRLASFDDVEPQDRVLFLEQIA
jgi:Trk K+ transport system NAD-binding subunit